MMKMIFAFLLVSLASFANETCFIDTFDQIVIIDENNLKDELVKFSDCSLETQQIFTREIKKMSGRVPQEIVQQWFTGIDVIIKPEMINVTNIKTFLNEHLHLKENLTLSWVKSLTGLKAFKFSSLDHLSAECTGCETSGEKTIKVTLFIGEQSFNSWWINAKILESRKALVSKEEIPTMISNLSTQLFEEKIIPVDNTKNLITDPTILKFYQPIKKIPGNKPLETTDLRPIELIKNNSKVNLIISTNDVEIKTTGTAKGQGKFGEFIEVINNKTNKKITAKIIDFNTVMVNL